MDLIFRVKKPERDKFVVVEPWRRHNYDVPAGFEFEASVPWWLRSIAGGVGRPRLIEPSCLHDYLWSLDSVSKKDADHIFYRDLKGAGVRGAWFFWLSVRIGALLRFKTLA